MSGHHRSLTFMPRRTHRQRANASPPPAPEGSLGAPPMPPPPPPFFPPNVLHHPVPIGHGQHLTMNAPWYTPPSYSHPYTHPYPGPGYPPFQYPHLAHGAGIGAAQFPPPGGMPRLMAYAPSAPVANLVATQAHNNDSTPPTQDAMQGGDATAPNVPFQPKKKRPNLETSEGGECLPCLVGDSTLKSLSLQVPCRHH